MPPPARPSKIRTSDPSGAMASRPTGNRLVLNSLMLLQIRMAPGHSSVACVEYLPWQKQARWKRGPQTGCCLRCEIEAEFTPRLCACAFCRSRRLLQIDNVEQLPKSGRFQGQPDLGLNVGKPNFNATPAQPPAILD